MRLPDFLVVGAQKSGTTSLFLLLNKHPGLCLPARKELQFFSADTLYERGLEWYSQTYFSGCRDGTLAGEVSPQYLYSTEIARRVHTALPATKIIAILREPLDRAYSQYLMSSRRGQETRPVAEAFAASSQITEDNEDAPEHERYFQFSNYERVLSEYLRLYGRDRILILFQEDLDNKPAQVLRRVTDFLECDYVEPSNLNVRAHRSGKVRSKAIDRLARGNSTLRRVIRSLTPAKLRPTVRFWTEIVNVKPSENTTLPPEIHDAYREFARCQAEFLQREFGISPPWKGFAPGGQEPPKT